MDGLPSESLIRRHEFSLDLAIIFLTRNRLKREPPCYRAGWLDSSPVGGVDWSWSQYVEIEKRRLLDTFETFCALKLSIDEYVAAQEEDHSAALAARMLEQEDLDMEEDDFADETEFQLDWLSDEFKRNVVKWQPLHDTLRKNLLMHIHTPAGMGSGHRGLSDKAALEVWKWSIDTPHMPCSEMASSLPVGLTINVFADFLKKTPRAFGDSAPSNLTR